MRILVFVSIIARFVKGDLYATSGFDSDIRHLTKFAFKAYEASPSSGGGQFVCAFVNNELYCNIGPCSVYTCFRGSMTRLGLFKIRSSVSDVLAAFNTDDVPSGETGPPLFSCNRIAGDTYPLLWPDWDFYGWINTWIAPFDVISREFVRSAPAWDDRASRAFWMGSPNSEIRKEFKLCRDGVDHDIRHNAEYTVDAWRLYKQGRVTKPESADLRRMLAYKYLVYLHGVGWSTSLKRELASGAAVLVPRPLPFDDLVSLNMRECNCTIDIPASQLCAAVASAVSGDDRERGAAAAEYARKSLSIEAVEAYSMRALNSLADYQDNDGMTVDALEALGFEHITCQRALMGILRDNNGPQDAGKLWQLNEWYNTTTCDTLPAAYIESVPI